MLLAESVMPWLHQSFLEELQGAVTVAVRYGAMRRQFGPAGGAEISVLDYRSQQEKLMPLLASAYGIHFTTRYLVMQYAEAKRTKEEDVIADVHALSAGGCCTLTVCACKGQVLHWM